MVSSTRCDMWYVQFIQKIHVFSSFSRPCFLLPLLLFFFCFYFKLSSGICSYCPLFLWLLGSNFWESTWGCYDFYSLVIFFYWTIFSFVWCFCLCKRCFNCLSVFLSGSIIFIHYFRVVGATRKALLTGSGIECKLFRLKTNQLEITWKRYNFVQCNIFARVILSFSRYRKPSYFSIWKSVKSLSFNFSVIAINKWRGK